MRAGMERKTKFIEKDGDLSNFTRQRSDMKTLTI